MHNRVTWFALADSVGDILHEYAAFELQFGSTFPVSCLFVLVLLLLRIHLFAAQQDHLEQVDFVLSYSLVVTCSLNPSCLTSRSSSLPLEVPPLITW